VSAYLTTCAVCATPIQAQRSTRKTCSGACRERLRIMSRDRMLADAARLLRDQTAALQAGGDPVVLAELTRRAERLFGH
jgi:predicted nucleic acid-binding Zn ribbon protein